MIDCSLPKNRSHPQCRVILRNRCMTSSISGMAPRRMRGCINTLLFKTPRNLKATDPELLSIVVLRNKKRHFDFLEGRTRWNTMGDWKDPTGKAYDSEKNIQLDIQFKDRKDEMIGKRLIELFNGYNKRVVGEQLLYSRTVPVEETSLK